MAPGENVTKFLRITTEGYGHEQRQRWSHVQRQNTAVNSETGQIIKALTGIVIGN